MTDFAEQVLREIATSKSGTVGQRLTALDKILKLERARMRDELRQQRLELDREKTRVRRREADASIVVAQVDKIRSKALLFAEQRKKRAQDKRESRQLDKALND